MQVEIAKGLTEGCSQKELAEKLGVSTSTVSRAKDKFISKGNPAKAWIKENEDGEYELTDYGKKMVNGQG